MGALLIFTSGELRTHGYNAGIMKEKPIREEGYSGYLVGIAAISQEL